MGSESDQVDQVHPNGTTIGYQQYPQQVPPMYYQQVQFGVPNAPVNPNTPLVYYAAHPSSVSPSPIQQQPGFLPVHSSAPCQRDVSRSLGDTTKLVTHTVLGFFFPILSSIAVFALETPVLSRLGNLFGNFNMFLWLGVYFISIGRFDDEMAYDTCRNNQYYYNNYNNGYNNNYYYDSYYCNYTSVFYYISIPFFVVAAVLLGFVIKYACGFFKEYKNRLPSEDIAKYGHLAKGSKADFALGFLASFLVPILGSGIVLISNRRLNARYGVLTGLSTFFIAAGIAFTPFWFLGFLSGNAPFIVGLFLLEVSIIHFKKILLIAHN